MVKFKVVKASKLLLILSVAALLVVIGVIIFVTAVSDNDMHPSGSLVQATDTAKTQTVFAVSQRPDQSDDMLTLDPESGSIEIEILSETAEDTHSAIDIDILIYHTHSHEAYEQVETDPYIAVEAWRTTDTGHSVVKVGEELAEALRKYGFEVVHDTTDHECNDLSTAYSRSLETLMEYENRFDLYIDLHRDAYYSGLEMRLESIDNVNMAQLMMLVGNGNGFEEKPYYTENYMFAKALTKRINSIYPGLCRDVLVKDGRYNQHIGVFSVLIEVGHNLNTLDEALNSVDPLAAGIYDLMIKNPDMHLESVRNKSMLKQNQN